MVEKQRDSTPQVDEGEVRKYFTFWSTAGFMGVDTNGHLFVGANIPGEGHILKTEMRETNLPFTEATQLPPGESILVDGFKITRGKTLGSIRGPSYLMVEPPAELGLDPFFITRNYLQAAGRNAGFNSDGTSRSTCTRCERHDDVHHRY